MEKEQLPPGDGHPVVIFPGLAADRLSTKPLKNFCEQLGYTAYDWGRGFNTGPQGDVDAWLDELAQHVRELTSTQRQKVSLIGWSLGGIYAREVAKILRGRVRQVITIGTPFAGTTEQTNVAWVYRLVNGQKPLLRRSADGVAFALRPRCRRRRSSAAATASLHGSRAFRTATVSTPRTSRSTAVISGWVGTLRCFRSLPIGCGQQAAGGSRTP